jgi:uncharacterized protein (TIGR04255 family)
MTDTNKVTRSLDLPDFKSPPINEVVMGVQFSAPNGYNQIRASEVWSLFKEDFPSCEEHRPLSPEFETFGRQPGTNMIEIGLMPGSTHSRYWFVSPKSDQLIQFQQDRFLHNWRKLGDQSNQYVRFDTMVVEFEKELRKLENYFDGIIEQKLNITQIELSYINTIEINQNASSDDPFAALSFVKLSDRKVETFSFKFQEQILNNASHPVGRLYCEASSRINSAGRPIIYLELTVRGVPVNPNIESALEFLITGRKKIVQSFAQITSDEAHKAWSRTQ